jgi:hypothetical protein
MSSANYRVRRATLEDIAPLMPLWSTMRFAAEDLARHITEFQVAEGPDGALLGGVALQIVERQGRVHSEAFVDFALADQLRPLLWDRIQSVAANHGLLRLWTQEDAPFWSRCGLQRADEALLGKLPAAWRDSPGAWQTLKLKEDLEKVISADQEFALFMAAEKEKTQRAFRQARLLKGLATAAAFVLLVLVVVAALYVLRHRPGMGR